MAWVLGNPRGDDTITIAAGSQLFGMALVVVGFLAVLASNRAVGIVWGFTFIISSLLVPVLNRIPPRGKNGTASFGDTKTVDIVALSASRENGVDLFIVEKAANKDEDDRALQLFEKMNTYVGYVMGDDFAREHPKTKPSNVLIRVLYATPPNAQMKLFKNLKPKGDRVNRIPVTFEEYNAFTHDPKV
jgi:hypothetical protein